jgi:hypothetical protein
MSLEAAVNDTDKNLAGFAIWRTIGNLGKSRPRKVRAILDNADLHSKPDKKTGKMPPEIKAAQLVLTALGEQNIRGRAPQIDGRVSVPAPAFDVRGEAAP